MAAAIIVFLAVHFFSLLASADAGRSNFSVGLGAGDDDSASLLLFASAVTSDPTGALSGWGAPGSDVCDWTGVTCLPATRRVAQLVLTGRGLRGTISSAVSNLSSLVVLDLSENFFSGVIPPAIGYLSSLQQLSLSKNLLAGSIPVEFGLLRRLIYLDLDGNQLTGAAPKTLFCNCTSLQYIDLSNNSLAGEIPLADECRLPDLKFILLWSNNFVGPIPLALSNSSKLEWIDFESNRLSGVLPSAIFDKMPFLQYLYLSYNNLSSHDSNTNLAPFFASLINCSRLQELELAGNNLGGRIPLLLGDLSVNLVQLHLDDNAISGPIPPNISNLLNLTYLNLSHNYLNGSIPPDLSPLRKLERVYLSNNLLSGEIPQSLGGIPHLGLVDMSWNKLDGSIPESLSNLTQLRTLMLHKNQLSGEIPASLGACVNLEILDLSFNRLTGRIPAAVAALGSIKLYLNLSSNLLEGPLPPQLGEMNMILALDFSDNRFSGGILPQLGGCLALEYLNLSGNVMQGLLPSSVGALPYLQTLDISFNSFSGAVPETLQASTSLKQLNLSFNNFSGELPSKGLFASLTADSFLGNPNLCGSIPGMSSCSTQRAHRRRKALALPLSIAGTICTIFLMCSLIKRRRSKYSWRLSPLFPATGEEEGGGGGQRARRQRHHPRITHRQLVKATGGFSDANLVGQGRFGQVYKGTFDNETAIAVKVLVNSGGEISKSFKRECQVLRRTRHRNLIRVITACSEPEFKALVLPLMPNGSLERYLYQEQRSAAPPLDLRRMVSILSDVAEGVAYLHHHAPVKVVHCDLKPSNVLLDEDMTALVSDFGISRLVRGIGPSSKEEDDDESSACNNSITGLLQGSVGYIAPEYGLGGRPSPEGDVYSYGVVVLEMVAGKRPTDVMFHEGVTLHEWVRIHYPQDVDSVSAEAKWRALPPPTLAPHQSSLYYKKMKREVVAELIEVGLLCTQVSPATRPTMLDVARRFSLLKQDLARYDDDAAAGDVEESSSSTTNSSSF
ncbi:putative leucine-rich repeat receptor-like serine/threonine-protein kinase At2g24130 [Zingiber officinale]|uniref:non-specific serine/threonine protein kinase n=1 Tax=Zingiber officinale TaxID=94328 RepID=A0A8J5G3L1_ZINOF|nr:putative leucine-rich repeat receptor-like serine/threonine-protein kinase At2g24130 [Zingiber officinale]KAG6499830.1 hypothetical protein ZIOFF_039625 [Zingiber officinale]